jgi:signal peptidase II
MSKLGRTVVLLALVVVTVGCDRITKHIAATSLEGVPRQSFFADVLRLEYTENPGGFLSLGADLPPAIRSIVFQLGAGVMLVGLLLIAIRLRWTGWPPVGVSLAFAGGMSNWIDRVLRGSVIDFLNIGIGHLRTGIFNFADVAIMLGVCILLVNYHQLNFEAEAESHK